MRENALRQPARAPARAGGKTSGSLSRLLFINARPGMQALWAAIVLSTLVYVIYLPSEEVNPSMVAVMMVSFALVLVCSVLFPYGERHPYAFFALMCGYLVLVSSVVYFTGGRSSLLGFLFLVIPVYAAHYYSYAGTLLVALATTAARFIPFMSGDVTSVEALTLGLSAIAYVVTGFIACYIVESERFYGGRSTEFRKLLEISRNRDSEVAVLCNLSRSLPGDLDLDSVLSRTVELALEILPCEGALLYLGDDCRESPAAAAGGLAVEDFSSASPHCPDGWLEALRAGRCVTSRKAELGWLPLRDADGRSAVMGSLEAAPLVSGGEYLGCLICYSTDRAAFRRLHSGALATLAGRASTAIGNARLYARTLYEKSRFETIFRSARDGLLVVSPGGTLVGANPVARCFLGPGTEESGEPACRLLERLTGVGADVPAADVSLASALRGEGSSGEYSLDAPAGRTFELSFVPLDSGGDSPSGAVVFMHDITELKKLDEMKTNFVSNVSHELRSPLTSITGYAGILLSDPDPGALSPVQREQVETIKQQSFRLSAMIDDLLELSRLAAGGGEIDGGEVDIAAVVELSVAQLALAAREKGISIDTRREGDLPVVRGDADRLGHVVTNLVGNAIKYTESGGSVTVTSVPDGPFVTVKVADTGCGIPACELPQLFDRFFRARRGGKPGPGGFGLGLAISRDIIRIHGGDIWVESEPGLGSTFCFTVPALPAGSGAPA